MSKYGIFHEISGVAGTCLEKITNKKSYPKNGKILPQKLLILPQINISCTPS